MYFLSFWRDILTTLKWHFHFMTIGHSVHWINRVFWFYCVCMKTDVTWISQASLLSWEIFSVERESKRNLVIWVSVVKCFSVWYWVPSWKCSHFAYLLVLVVKLHSNRKFSFNNWVHNDYIVKRVDWWNLFQLENLFSLTFLYNQCFLW